MSSLESLYNVLINDDGQYSYWPYFKNIPSGWRKICDEINKDECFEYIEEHWEDINELSLLSEMKIEVGDE